MVSIQIEDLQSQPEDPNFLVSTDIETRAKHHLPEPCSHFVENVLIQHQIFPKICPDVVKEHFYNEGRLSIEQIKLLFKQSNAILKDEPNLVRVDSLVGKNPCKKSHLEISSSWSDFALNSPVNFSKAVSKLINSANPVKKPDAKSGLTRETVSATKEKLEDVFNATNIEKATLEKVIYKEDLSVSEEKVSQNRLHSDNCTGNSISTNQITDQLQEMKIKSSLNYSFLPQNKASRTVIIGDIHGQFYDLLNILSNYDLNTDTLIFLGDYVDRGRFSTEVYFYLLSLKIFYPNKVILLRGNHETEKMTKYFTFKEECLFKYSGDVYKRCLVSFQSLPLCCLVDSKYFCAHGGIGPKFEFSIVNKFNRFCEPPFEGLFCDILWSDPHPRYEIGSFDNEFLRNTQRNCSYFYTPKGVTEFFKRTGVECIIRGHEVQSNGYRFYSSLESKNFKEKKILNEHKGDDDSFSLDKIDATTAQNFNKTENRDFNEVVTENSANIASGEQNQSNKTPNTSLSDTLDSYSYSTDSHSCNVDQSSESSSTAMLTPDIITIFSAPNYCDAYSNLASVLQVYPSFKISRFSSVSHPYYLPNYLDAINWSYPFVSEKLSEYFLDLLKYLEEQESVISSPLDTKAENEIKLNDTFVQTAVIQESDNNPDNLAAEMQKTVQFANAMVLLRTEREGTTELEEESTDLSLVSITDPDLEIQDFEEAKSKDTRNEMFKTDKDLKNGFSTDLSASLCVDNIKDDISLEKCQLQIDGKKVQVVVPSTKKKPSMFCWSSKNS